MEESGQPRKPLPAVRPVYPLQINRRSTSEHKLHACNHLQTQSGANCDGSTGANCLARIHGGQPANGAVNC